MTELDVAETTQEQQREAPMSEDRLVDAMLELLSRLEAGDMSARERRDTFTMLRHHIVGARARLVPPAEDAEPVLRAALELIRSWPHLKSPEDAANAMQDIARAALEAGGRKEEVTTG